VDRKIEGELARSRGELEPLLAARESLVREACAPRPDGVSDLILEFATRRAPQTFSPSEVHVHAKALLGEMSLNLITAWLTKLVRAGALTRKRRGEYGLA